MSSEAVLDQALIKDLLNHIYEKRKATAFQIEGFTKQALTRNDYPTIYKIISELTELLDGVSTSATMGAITALGSVSVALGSFAIAYFLDDIVRPIFRTFRDTDARVRYYACESLYNIAKIARGEILLYFNEIFDILCVLVTDTESSVKNAADILDRLIKDIVSAKSTNYVSILHQQTDETSSIASHVISPDGGVGIQVNNPQDSSKAFLLPKFIPTLLERMYTIDPFAKKFLLSWLELFDDIPSLELLTFLPNFLEPLLRFLMNNCPSDVRVETQNLLNIFLKEIKAIHRVKCEIKREQLTKEKAKLTQGWTSNRATPQDGDDVENTPDPSKGMSELKLTSADLDHADAISVSSNSTTIIRRTDLKGDHVSGKPIRSEERASLTPPLAKDVSDDIHSESDSVFIDGQDIFIDYPRIIDILLSFLRTGMPTISSDSKLNDLAGESHEIYLEIQLTALRWLQEIVSISPTSFSKFLPDCVSINMQNVALTDDNNDKELRNHFLKFNLALQSYLVKLNEIGHEKTLGDLDEENYDAGLMEITENQTKGLNEEALDNFVEFYLNKTLQVVMGECLRNVNELARLTSLDWLMFLYSNFPSSFFESGDKGENEGSVSTDKYMFDLTSLLKSSTDASNEVISKVLSLASKVSENNQDFFKEFMIKLISLFETDGFDTKPQNTGAASNQKSNNQVTLTRDKVEFIIRRLCVSISPEKIFNILSEVLVTFEQSNLEFISNTIVTLNNILLTSKELAGFRKKLKNMDFYKNEDWSLFSTLFQSWCHNPPSALSICLLTSNYELAFLIIKNLGELEVNYQLLAQLDILIQLLETPIFLKLRLQLLEPEKHPHLFKTLYGILMIMPQSSTYTTLNNRLMTVAPFNNVSSSSLLSTPNTPATTPGAVSTSVNAQLSTRRKRIHEMADKFVKVNEMHESYNKRKQLEEQLADKLKVTEVSGSSADVKTSSREKSRMYMR